MDIGQTKVTTAVPISQLFVVDAQLVQDRGVHVVNVHGLLDDVVAELIRLAVHHRRLDTAAGHPD